MLFVDRETGICRRGDRRPGENWDPVKGRGALFRRRERGAWRAAYAFEPDTPLWLRQGWEGVHFGPARSAGGVVRGSRSRLQIAFAPLHRDEMRARDGLWVVLPELAAREAPAERPGAQAWLRWRDLRAGVPPAELAARLLTGRIIARGLPLDRALWVLEGPPVSPDDARMTRQLRPVLTLAEKLSADLAELVEGGAAGATLDSDVRPDPAAAREREPGAGLAATRRASSFGQGYDEK